MRAEYVFSDRVFSSTINDPPIHAILIGIVVGMIIGVVVAFHCQRTPIFAGGGYGDNTQQANEDTKCAPNGKPYLKGKSRWGSMPRL
ncbi:MAG TPA: hypothetical protein VKQ36_00440 [Ktedonobacterales bacterium]|nr:hypothetical protein [Ktedonobacterales bacterium]